MSVYNVGDPGSISGSGRPWRRKWQSTPVLLPGKSHGQRSLVGYSQWGHKLKTKFLPHIYQSTAATNANIEKEGQLAGESGSQPPAVAETSMITKTKTSFQK